MQPAMDVDMEFEASRGQANCKNNHHEGQNKTHKPFITSKYRTKMCRNYLMGIPCPFEERCIYAHGEEQLRQAPLKASNNAATPVANAANTATASQVSSPVAEVAPSYDSIIATDAEAAPARPSRWFRHDPYSTAGAVYQ